MTGPGLQPEVHDAPGWMSEICSKQCPACGQAWSRKPFHQPGMANPEPLIRKDLHAKAMAEMLMNPPSLRGKARKTAR
jgi:hypothetical protein